MFFNIAFKMVVNPYRCAPRWTTSVKQIACTQCEILADIRDDFIDFKEHIASKALLNRSAVDVKSKAKALNGFHFV